MSEDADDLDDAAAEESCGAVNAAVAFKWQPGETTALLEIWSQEDIQWALNVRPRGNTTWRHISDRLFYRGYRRTGVHCRRKMERMLFRYELLRFGQPKSATRHISPSLLRLIDVTVRRSEIKYEKDFRTTYRIHRAQKRQNAAGSSNSSAKAGSLVAVSESLEHGVVGTSGRSNSSAAGIQSRLEPSDVRTVTVSAHQRLAPPQRYISMAPAPTGSVVASQCFSVPAKVAGVGVVKVVYTLPLPAVGLSDIPSTVTGRVGTRASAAEGDHVRPGNSVDSFVVPSNAPADLLVTANLGCTTPSAPTNSNSVSLMRLVVPDIDVVRKTSVVSSDNSASISGAKRTAHIELFQRNCRAGSDIAATQAVGPSSDTGGGKTAESCLASGSTVGRDSAETIHPVVSLQSDASLHLVATVKTSNCDPSESEESDRGRSLVENSKLIISEDSEVCVEDEERSEVGSEETSSSIAAVAASCAPMLKFQVPPMLPLTLPKSTTSAKVTLDPSSNHLRFLPATLLEASDAREIPFTRSQGPVSSTTTTTVCSVYELGLCASSGGGSSLVAPYPPPPLSLFPAPSWPFRLPSMSAIPAPYGGTLYAVPTPQSSVSVNTSQDRSPASEGIPFRPNSARSAQESANTSGDGWLPPQGHQSLLLSAAAEATRSPKPISSGHLWGQSPSSWSQRTHAFPSFSTVDQLLSFSLGDYQLNRPWQSPFWSPTSSQQYRSPSLERPYSSGLTTPVLRNCSPQSPISVDSAPSSPSSAAGRHT